MSKIFALMIAILSTNAFAQLSVRSEHYLLGENNWVIHGRLDKPYFSTDLIHWEPNLQASTIVKTLHRLQTDPASGQACVVVRRDVFSTSNCTSSKKLCSFVVERNGVVIESSEIRCGIDALDWLGPDIYYRNSIQDKPVIGRNQISIWNDNLGNAQFSAFAEWPNSITFDHLALSPKEISKPMYEALLPKTLPNCSSDF
jgi:hypothetical protein